MLLHRPQSCQCRVQQQPNMNQSGIQVSQELQKTYSTLPDSVSTLKISIIDDQLRPNGTLDRQGNDEKDFNATSQLVTDTEAAYLLVRLSDETILVNYVAENAAVRDKMTYASTRNTLARMVKADRSYFATLKSELSWSALGKDSGGGGSAVSGGDAAGGALSKSELELRDIKAGGEQEINSTSSKRAIASSGVGLPIEDAAIEALNVLQTASTTRYVSLRCDLAQEIVKLDSTSDCALDDLSTKVVLDGPRYLFISHSYVSDDADDGDDDTTAGKHGAAKLVFCYVCPTDCKVKERMLYSSNRASVLQASGLKVDVRYEAEELDVADLKSRIEPPKKERVQTFTKPKRPGRK